MLRIILLCLACAGLCGSTDPGVKLRLTQNAINYVNQLAHDQIVKQLKAITIPEQSGQDGHLSYNLYNIHIPSVTPPGSAISLVPGKNGITWSLTNFGISVHADWRVKYKRKLGRISTSGNVDISLSGISVTETAAFGIDGSGRPSIASSGCSSSVGGVSIRFHGGVSSIINKFSHIVERKGKDMLQPKICQEVVKVINNNAAQSLASMKVNVELAHRFLLDYRLVSAPLVTADFLEISDKGEVYWKEDVKESPFSPKPIPPLTDNSRMVYIWVTDYTPNTFLYQGHTNDFLKYTVTKEDLPQDQESYLNTSCLIKCIGTIIPQIGRQYPKSTIELGLKTAKVPSLSLTSDTVTAQLDMTVDMWARTPDNKLDYLCTLGMDISLTLKPNIKDEKLTAVISDHSFHLSVIKSDIGTIFPSVYNLAISGVLNFVVIPKLNKIAAIGVDLPVVKGVEFVNFNLHLQEGNLLIATDLHYSGDGTLRYKAEQDHCKKVDGGAEGQC